MHKNDLQIDPQTGSEIMSRIEELALRSEDTGKLTRQYLSPQHAAANQLVAGWMQEAGMQTHIDAVGNVIGRYEARNPDQPALIFGSHLDTVRDAGRFDGMLGVLTPLSCVKHLHQQNIRLDHAIEVIGFADEEGVRFQSTLLGSRAVAGTFEHALLEHIDNNGISMANAMREFGLDPDRIDEAARNREQVLAYVELHIEQGPVLEAEGKALGIVSSIAGATRMNVNVRGQAGHAGTVPMNLRRDALVAACEMVCNVEREILKSPHAVGTVGQLEVEPGAVNVIPGDVVFSIDIRAGDDAVRRDSVERVRSRLADVARSRNIEIDIIVTHEMQGCQCAEWLMTQLESATRKVCDSAPTLASGAGHDAMAMVDLTDVAMLFVRCEAGISHNPAENISAEDAFCGAAALLHFMADFQIDSTG